MLRALGVRMEAWWLPSAVNRYADSLSRQWDPGDVRVTEELVQSLSNAYALGGRFPAPSGWGAPDCPSKVPGDPDGGGLGRWAGPAMEPTVRPAARCAVEDRGRPCTWGPNCASVAHSALVRAAAQIGVADARRGSGGYRALPHRAEGAQPRVGARGGRDRTFEERSSAIRDSVLTWTGASATGGARPSLPALPFGKHVGHQE
jgi:hypothetical protein